MDFVIFFFTNFWHFAAGVIVISMILHGLAAVIVALRKEARR